jgi:gluconokinase
MTDLVIIMGVAGSGKSSIAEALAASGGWPFIEADDHHSAANKQKMASGTPLTDADRADWVGSLCRAVSARPEARVILACSALTPYVQDGLRAGAGRACRFVLLDVPREELARRIAARQDHFMPVSLLDSQLEALQPPDDVLVVDGTGRPDVLLAQIQAILAEA